MPPISTALIIFNMSLCISRLSWVIVSLTICIVCIVVNIFIEFWWFLSILFPSLTIQVWVSDLLICLENQGRRRRTWRSWLLFKPWCFGWQVRSKDECSLAFSVHLLSIHSSVYSQQFWSKSCSVFCKLKVCSHLVVCPEFHCQWAVETTSSGCHICSRAGTWSLEDSLWESGSLQLPVSPTDWILNVRFSGEPSCQPWITFNSKFVLFLQPGLMLLH